MEFKTVKELDAAIESVLLGASNIKKIIQYVAVGIVSHAAGKGNGNVTRAKKLVDGLGAGFKQDSLVEWFAQVGIMFDEEGNVSLDRKLLNKENFNQAKAKNWYEFKKQNPYRGYVLKDEIIRVIKKANAAKKKQGEDAELVEVDDSMLAELMKVLPAADRPALH